MLLIKIGGGADINWEGICMDTAEISKTEKVILVHGASVQRDAISEKLGIPVKTVISPSGIPSVYTDKEALDVFLMVYAGLVNKRIVEQMQQHGLNAVGLSGADGRIWEAKAKKEIFIKEGEKTKLLKNNLTGKVEKINTELISLLLAYDYLPVISAPALSYENEIVNTDNDWAVAVMSENLKIRKLVYLFQAPGFLMDPADAASLIPRIDRAKIADYFQYAQNRMKRKILGANRAIEGGVEAIYMGDGRVENPVMNALEGRGTVIS